MCHCQSEVIWYLMIFAYVFLRSFKLPGSISKSLFIHLCVYIYVNLKPARNKDECLYASTCSRKGIDSRVSICKQQKNHK